MGLYLFLLLFYIDWPAEAEAAHIRLMERHVNDEDNKSDWWQAASPRGSYHNGNGSHFSYGKEEDVAGGFFQALRRIFLRVFSSEDGSIGSLDGKGSSVVYRKLSTEIEEGGDGDLSNVNSNRNSANDLSLLLKHQS